MTDQSPAHNDIEKGKTYAETQNSAKEELKETAQNPTDNKKEKGNTNADILDSATAESKDNSETSAQQVPHKKVL